MSGGEIAVLAFIVAAFTIFGVTLAWISHHDAPERARKRPEPAPDAETSSGKSYQGADG